MIGQTLLMPTKVMTYMQQRQDSIRSKIIIILASISPKEQPSMGFKLESKLMVTNQPAKSDVLFVTNLSKHRAVAMLGLNLNQVMILPLLEVDLQISGE